MKHVTGLVVTILVAGAAAIARGQPAPGLPPVSVPPAPPDTGGTGVGSDARDGGSAANPDGTAGQSGTPDAQNGSSAPDGPTPDGRAALHPDDPYTNAMNAGESSVPRGTSPPPAPRVPDPRLDAPMVLTTPTGWLLPAAVLYTREGIDTGGGFTSDSRVGLGDVAEFGVATTNQVRQRLTLADKPEQIQPYVTASFRIGVAEDRLFKYQPGLVLGFRKSFEREHDGEKTRIAELTFVASKHLGPRAAVHVGGAFWDASIQKIGEGQPEVTLHGFDDRSHQIRAFGGIEARPLERSSILVDLGWAPEFCYQCTGKDQIRLRPELSWGVRYEVASWMNIESGVRVPDIASANLLDAQIFGQLTLTSWALHHVVTGIVK